MSSRNRRSSARLLAERALGRRILFLGAWFWSMLAVILAALQSGVGSYAALWLTDASLDARWHYKVSVVAATVLSLVLLTIWGWLVSEQASRRSVRASFLTLCIAGLTAVVIAAASVLAIGWSKEGVDVLLGRHADPRDLHANLAGTLAFGAAALALMLPVLGGGALVLGPLRRLVRGGRHPSLAPSRSRSAAAREPGGPSRAEEHLARQADLPDLMRRRVLVVDDDPMWRRVVSAWLHSTGLFEVQTAGNADEALELLRRGPAIPDLMLLDVMMPGVSGPAFASALEHHRTLKHLRVVFCSARPADAVAHLAQLSHMAYVEKPVSWHRLREVVFRCLGLRLSESERGEENDPGLAVGAAGAA
jgi:CheY-like chemotaxis protein